MNQKISKLLISIALSFTIASQLRPLNSPIGIGEMGVLLWITTTILSNKSDLKSISNKSYITCFWKYRDQQYKVNIPLE